jgi:hypothetical protein
MSVEKLYIKKMIKHYGQEVMRKKRTKNYNGDEVYYTYSVEQPVKGHFMQITPVDEMLMNWGFEKTCDYIATFLPDTEIEEGDLLNIDDNWYEVSQKITRRTGEKVEYIETLLKLKESV